MSSFEIDPTCGTEFLQAALNIHQTSSSHDIERCNRGRYLGDSLYMRSRNSNRVIDIRITIVPNVYYYCKKPQATQGVLLEARSGPLTHTDERKRLELSSSPLQ